MKTIRAIETVYRGIRYRSRLEARWAVFFTELSIPFEYEKETFDLPGVGYYLPDFWLPEQECWVEIKGAFSQNDGKASRLAKHGEFPVYLFVGDIPYVTRTEFITHDDSAVYYPVGSGEDYGYRWCECYACGNLGIQFQGRADRLPCKRCFHCDHIVNPRKCGDGIYTYPAIAEGNCPVHGTDFDNGCSLSGHGDKGYNADSPRLISAYTAARSARFEFGQYGGMLR